MSSNYLGQEEQKTSAKFGESRKRGSFSSRVRGVLFFIVSLYILVTAPLLYKFWDIIFYAVTHPEDIKWIQNLKGDAWEEKKLKMLEEKRVEIVPQQEEKQVSMEVDSKKKRLPENLAKLLAGTPMEKMADALANNQHNVSPYLIVGIAKAESSLGKSFYHQSDSKNFNYWGIKPKGGIRDDGSYLKWYASPEEAVNDCARILKEVYIDQGLDTPEKIVKKYVGRDSETWKSTVNSIVSLQS